MSQLVVILGAGASHDCSGATRVPDRQPPLVQDLFAPRFSTILHQYPLAEAAAADIRGAVSSGAVPLEQYLRERLRGATDRYAQQRYRAVPLYLQHLFVLLAKTDGNGYTTHPDNYDVLANATLELDEVVFVTLNYDTLLDRRLFLYESGAPSSMDSYIETDRNWSLIKLHGSANWGRAVRPMPPLPADVPGALNRTDIQELNRTFASIENLELADEIALRDVANDDIVDMRYDRRGPWLYYPALSIPLGSEDELVCPDPHVKFLRERLRRQDGLTILVIGYSGLDREVLQLLRESGNELRTMLVVNGSETASLAGVEAVSAVFGAGFREEWIYPGEFSEFVRKGELRDWVSGIT